MSIRRGTLVIQLDKSGDVDENMPEQSNAASSKRVFVKIVYMDPTVIILAVVAINS